MSEQAQKFVVMGSAEQRVWDLARKLCELRNCYLPNAGKAPCEWCRELAGKLLDETVAK